MKRSSRALGYCPQCQKLLYTDRKTAKKVARQHHEDHKSVYPCPINPILFHVGGVPDEVISGALTRGEYFHAG
jgi:hypothetical protein